MRHHDEMHLEKRAAGEAEANAPRRRTALQRPGFTLVELLVSMALIMFIMVILSEAFIQSVTAFSQLKAVGDLQEKMRAATIILRRDLKANHFTPMTQAGGSASSDVTLSSWDMRIDQPPDGVAGFGFFRVWQGFDTEQDQNGNLVADRLEGVDDVQNTGNTSTGIPPSGIPSSRAANHILHFTAMLPGIRPEAYFSAQIQAASDWPLFVNDTTAPPTAILGAPPLMLAYDSAHLYFSQWAEIAYFLRPTGENAGSTPLYALFRRQKVALNSSPSDKTASNFDTTGSANRRSSTELNLYTDMSCNVDQSSPNFLYFNGPDDLTIPERRMFANQTPGSGGLPPTGPSSPLPTGYTGSLQQVPWYASFADAPSSQLAPGDDLLLQDVISFEVKALYDLPTAVGSDFQLFPVCGSNPALGSNSIYAGVGARVFDTWSSKSGDTTYPGYSTWSTPGSPYSIPLKVRVRALQITIRVWDKKTQQARQITLVQDM